jgi:hypothetical protein
MYNNNMGYNGYYGQGFVNPYTMQQQQQQYELQQQQQYNSEYNKLRDIFKSLDQFYNGPLSPEEEKEFDNDFENKFGYKAFQEEQLRMQQQQQLINNMRNDYPKYPIPIPREQIEAMELINRNIERNKELGDISLGELMTGNKMEDKGLEYTDEIMSTKLQKNSNLGAIYNRSQYNDLINMHSNNSSSGMYNALLNGPNVDDLTVSLPDHLKNEHAMRKAKFLEAIMNN